MVTTYYDVPRSHACNHPLFNTVSCFRLVTTTRWSDEGRIGRSGGKERASLPQPSGAVSGSTIGVGSFPI